MDNAFLDGGVNALISNSLNSGVDGRYSFFARNGQVIVSEPPTATPEAGTSLGLLALAGFGLTSIYKKKKIQA